MLLDPESLSTLKTFSDTNKFAKNCTVLSECFNCFLTFAQSKSVLSYWHFGEVDSSVETLQTVIFGRSYQLNPTGFQRPFVFLRQSANQPTLEFWLSTTLLAEPCCNDSKSAQGPFANWQPTHWKNTCSYFTTTAKSSCTIWVDSSGKTVLCLLQKKFTWDQCFVGEICKHQNPIKDFNLIQTSPDLVVVSSSQSVWLHQIGSKFISWQC